jgi:hypothetical protein
MKTPNEDYEPFGPEWEKELMKLPKKFIIDLYRKAAIKAALYEQEYGHVRQHLRDVIKSHEE